MFSHFAGKQDLLVPSLQLRPTSLEMRLATYMFLAAWHVSRLGSEEQAKAVSDILHSSPLSPVLPFFTGLTGLSNPVLLEVTKHSLDILAFVANRPWLTTPPASWIFQIAPSVMQELRQ